MSGEGEAPDVSNQRVEDRLDSLRNEMYEQGKALSKLHGVMEERTSNLEKADVEAKRDIGSLRTSIDAFRTEMAKDLKIISSQVTEGRVKMGVIVGVSAAVCAGASATIIQLFVK